MENRTLFFSREYNDFKRFASYFHQLDLTLELNPESVLEIGKGNGIISHFLKDKLGFSSVVTLDCDADLDPDYTRDVRELDLRQDSFDVVLAFEILEHIPFKDFEKSLAKIKFVAKKNVVISLPINKGFWGLKDGMVTECHEWEINKDHPLSEIRAILNKYFTIKKEVNSRLNPYHQFFVLEVKA